MPAAAAAAAEAAPAGGVTAAEDAAVRQERRRERARVRARSPSSSASSGQRRRCEAVECSHGGGRAELSRSPPLGNSVVVVSGDVVSGERFGFKNLYNHVNLTPSPVILCSH